MATEQALRMAEALEAAGRDVTNTMSNRAVDISTDSVDCFRHGILFTIACCESALHLAKEAAREYGTGGGG